MTPPTLANTDGDPMLPQRLYFDIASADEAFHALKDLAVGEDEKDLLKEAVFENGSMVGAKLAWLGGSDEVRKRLGGPVLLGSFTIERKRLIIEVNSQKRADLIRRLVESRLGDRATYKSTLIEPIESQIREMWQTASASRGSSARDRSPFPGASPFISLDEAPELRAALEENARQYWESWLDVPLPALDDMTPHCAARTEEGRELLESLLLTFESHAGEGDENLFEPDTVALRAKLGMA